MLSHVTYGSAGATGRVLPDHDQEALRELAQIHGVEVANHAITRVRLRRTEAQLAETAREIAEIKADLDRAEAADRPGQPSDPGRGPT